MNPLFLPIFGYVSVESVLVLGLRLFDDFFNDLFHFPSTTKCFVR